MGIPVNKEVFFIGGVEKMKLKPGFYLLALLPLSRCWHMTRGPTTKTTQIYDPIKGGKEMKKSLLVLLVPPILIFSYVSLSRSQYYTTQLTNNDYRDLPKDKQYRVRGLEGSRFYGTRLRDLPLRRTGQIQITNNDYDD